MLVLTVVTSLHFVSLIKYRLSIGKTEEKWQFAEEVFLCRQHLLYTSLSFPSIPGKPLLTDRNCMVSGQEKGKYVRMCKLKETEICLTANVTTALSVLEKINVEMSNNPLGLFTHSNFMCHLLASQIIYASEKYCCSWYFLYEAELR